MRNIATTPIVQTTTRTPERTVQFVNDSITRAKEMMTKAGYKITDNVKVSVDPKLPFMGYTMPTGQRFNIVVSSGAVESRMLEGLLIHEMSHIYRIQTNHPSHNGEILEEAVQRIGKNAKLRDYQQKIVHDLLNDIQDLYADDIAFKVLRMTPLLRSEQMTEFLQSWVKDKPERAEDPVMERWTNASIMAHNARAIAQMPRHRIEDTGGRAAKANQTFLDQVSPKIAKEFDYFRGVLASLREDMTADDYRSLLAIYLDRFAAIAERD